jgi:polysaccharide export outer membrane protein/exopolysaccharide production protein ExoF
LEQKHHLEELQRMIAEQIASGTQQAATLQDRQITAEQEVREVSDLYARNLTTNARKYESIRHLTQVEGETRLLHDRLAQLRQELEKTKNAQAALYAAHRRRAIEELRATEAQIDSAKTRLQTFRLLHQHSTSTPMISASLVGRIASASTNRIVKAINGHGVVIEAEETTTLEPGDTLKVELATTSVDKKGVIAANPSERRRLDQWVEGSSNSGDLRW